MALNQKNHSWCRSASLGYGPNRNYRSFPWLFYQITRSCDQRGGANLPSFSAKLSASFWTVQYCAEALKPYLWFQSVDFLSRFTKRFSQKMLHTAVKVIRTYRQTTQNYLVHSTTEVGLSEPGAPDFARSVIPISSREDSLCPPHYYWPPGFSDLPTALIGTDGERLAEQSP